MSSDFARALARLEEQPHTYLCGRSKESNRVNSLRVSLRKPKKTSLVFVIANSNDPGMIKRVEVHLKRENPIDSNRRSIPPLWHYAKEVDLFVVFPELSDWLALNTCDGRVSAKAFFKGGKDIASRLGIPISIVHVHGQGRQEERQFSPCRVH